MAVNLPIEDIAQAAKLVPPTSLAIDLTVTAATPTAETDTGVTGEDGRQFTFTVGVAFNVRFGPTGLASPGDTASFVAGMYSVYLPPGTHWFFKITANATGKATCWISSRG